MAREIKFRAWNTITTTMVDLKKITPLAVQDGVPEGIFIPFHDSYKLMQFTGIKDVGGKDIYEGDIIQSHDIITHSLKTMPVIFENGCFYTPWKNSRYRLGGWKTVTIQIVGNIYENPELLNKE